jgi:beta-lactamase regulating signal transducer with metallopeptidase domain
VSPAVLAAGTDAVGWALVHASWQLSLLAVAVWVTLRALDHRSAELRHGVALTALFAAPLIFLATVIGHLDWTDGEVAVLADLTPTFALLGAQPVAAAAARWQLPDVFPALVLLWGIGVGLGGGNNLRSWMVARSLKVRGVRPAPMAVQAAADRLGRSLGLLRDVPVRISERVDVPMVVGALQPVVLLPVMALTGLDTAQLEAVLLHELAHVRRGDLWVAVAVALVEALLFFHPAIWWLVRRVRAEREQCCDDVVVGTAASSLPYARALLALAEHSSGVAHATALTDGSLQHRVQRIVGAAQPPNRAGPLWITAGILSLGLALVATTAVAADEALASRVERFWSMELRVDDASAARASQDGSLFTDLEEMTTEHAALQEAIDALWEADPERWGVTVAVRGGQVAEHLGRAIRDSDVPSYMTAEQASVYVGALESKAGPRFETARRLYWRALSFAQARGEHGALVDEARAGLARLGGATADAQPEPPLHPALELYRQSRIDDLLQMAEHTDGGLDAAMVWGLAGEALLDRSDAAGALVWFERAQQADPTAEMLTYKVAICAWHVGQRARAQALFKTLAEQAEEPVRGEARRHLNNISQGEGL